MKKMVCSVCGSQSLKKINNVFVCQECETEYSVEEAKALLVDIENNDSLSETPTRQNKDDSSKRIKLEYDLLCWHNFYSKCHDLEKSFYLKDKKINSNVDIVSREVVFDKEQYYVERVLPELNKAYVSSHESIKTDFENDKKKRIDNNKLYHEEIQQQSKNAKTFPIAGGIIITISIIIGIIMLITGIANAITPLIIFALVIPAAVIAGTFIFISYAGQKSATTKVKMMEVLSFDEYFDLYVKEKNEYKEQESKFREKYYVQVDKDINDFLKDIPQLKSVKDILEEKIPLPTKYSDERHVDALLALVLDKRADTLKEAINLYETESYRSTVVNSLNTLNYNIQMLNNNILALRKDINQLAEITYQGLSTLIQQNNAISNQLESIRFDSRFLMIDSLLS